MAFFKNTIHHWYMLDTLFGSAFVVLLAILKTLAMPWTSPGQVLAGAVLLSTLLCYHVTASSITNAMFEIFYVSAKMFVYELTPLIESCYFMSSFCMMPTVTWRIEVRFCVLHDAVYQTLFVDFAKLPQTAEPPIVSCILHNQTTSQANGHVKEGGLGLPLLLFLWTNQETVVLISFYSEI